MSLKRLKKQGFTLIELMIVVAIIGILAAIAVPKFADMVTKSKEASTKGSLGAVRSAVSIYYGDLEGEFPTNLYIGLTTEDKYMSATQGLGNFTVPKNGTNNGATHESRITLNTGVLQGPSGVGGVLTTTPPDDFGGNLRVLYYVNGGSRGGEVFINCTHKDTKGSVWTAY